MMASQASPEHGAVLLVRLEEYVPLPMVPSELTMLRWNDGLARSMTFAQSCSDRKPSISRICSDSMHSSPSGAGEVPVRGSSMGNRHMPVNAAENPPNVSRIHPSYPL